MRSIPVPDSFKLLVARGRALGLSDAKLNEMMRTPDGVLMAAAFQALLKDRLDVRDFLCDLIKERAKGSDAVRQQARTS